MLAQAADDLGVEGSLRRRLDQRSEEKLDPRVCQESAFDERLVLDPSKWANSIREDVPLRKHCSKVSRTKDGRSFRLK